MQGNMMESTPASGEREAISTIIAPALNRAWIPFHPWHHWPFHPWRPPSNGSDPIPLAGHLHLPSARTHARLPSIRHLHAWIPFQALEPAIYLRFSLDDIYVQGIGGRWYICGGHTLHCSKLCRILDGLFLQYPIATRSADVHREARDGVPEFERAFRERFSAYTLAAKRHIDSTTIFDVQATQESCGGGGGSPDPADAMRSSRPMHPMAELD
uniref:Uncharacterized protein n=1 Tax=Zea mays TaxID=4577 RepID=A0A804MNN0_MAIZE